MPGGTTRVTVQHTPIYIASGDGAWVTDVDGNRYLDFNNNYTTLIHGHAFQPVIDAVGRELHKGTCFFNPTRWEIELAEILCERVPAVHAVRFANTGTEAVMFAVKAARAFTDRPKVAKFEGAYHGAYDWVEVSENSEPGNWGDGEPRRVPYARGTPASVLEDVVVVPFNDIVTTTRVLERHAQELACLVIDLVPSRAGLIPLEPDYIAAIRRLTRRHGIVLISDEVLNFRQGYGGAAARFGLMPDLVTFGKIIGGGLPIGAVGGHADVMAVFDSSEGWPRLPQGGTFAANPLSMVAGIASMQALDHDAFARLERLGERVRSGLTQLGAVYRVPLQVTGTGSLFRAHLKETRPRTYREAWATPRETECLARMSRAMLAQGVVMPASTSSSCSTAMTDQDVDLFLRAFERALVQEKEALATLH